VRLVLILSLLAAPAFAGVAQYDACIGPEFEERLMANYAQRFPSDPCTSSATCPAAQVESTTRLTRGHCRTEALADCESQKCILGLKERWSSVAADLRVRIDARLADVDFDQLPALQARRLSDPDRWFTPPSCVGDANACEADWAGQALGDLERIAAEVEALQ